MRYAMYMVAILIRYGFRWHIERVAHEFDMACQSAI